MPKGRKYQEKYKEIYKEDKNMYKVVGKVNSIQNITQYKKP